jgi:hypothetical protein
MRAKYYSILTINSVIINILEIQLTYFFHIYLLLVYLALDFVC